MNKYSALLWTCVLVFLVLPWLLATIFVWVYTELYETQSESEEGSSPRLGYVTALLQTLSVFVYIVFTLGGLLCIGIVGRPDDLWTYCCLVLGVPVFFTIPVASGILLLVSSLSNVASTGRDIGITATILCFSSTLPCCCVLICALACGTRGKGKRSRYPTPIAYVPVLGELKQREDRWEVMKKRREFTDDYPADSPPGPLPSYKAARSKTTENGSVGKSSVAKSKESDGHRESRSSISVASDTNKKSSANSVLTQDVSKTEKDSSPRKFSLTAFLNARRKSSSTSQESKPVDGEPRRFSEPAVKSELTKEKSGQVKTESNSKPKSRVTNQTVKESRVVSNTTAPVKSNGDSGGKRSMFSKLRGKSDTSV